MKASIVIAGTAVAVAAGVMPAQATTSTVAPRAAVTKSIAFRCKVLTTTLPWATPFSVTRTPLAASHLKPVTVTIAPTRRYKTGPVPVVANTMRPVYKLKVNGRVVVVKGALNAKGIPSSTAFVVPPGKLRFTPRKGVNTIALVSLVFDHTIVDTTCLPTAPAPLSSFRAA